MLGNPLEKLRQFYFLSWRAGVGDAVGVPAWVRWLVYQREWRGWRAKVTSEYWW